MACMSGAMMYRRRRRRLKGETKVTKSLGFLVLRYGSLDYLFRLAVEMRTLGIPWTTT